MNWENHSALALIFGGLAFFMYGMSLVSEHLQKLAANRIQDLFRKISGKKYLAIFVGIALTVFLQSSGAVTSMLVGLGSADVVTLRQVMGLIVGTAVGTTFTVQIMSFHISQYGLPIFIVGFLFYFASKKRIPKSLAGVIVGFGLLFLGLDMMGQGTDIIRKYDFMMDVFMNLKANVFFILCLSALLSAIFQSSAVTLGFAMSLGSSGIFSFHEILYMIYGANIGTTATALVASVGSNYVGRQVAWAHFFYKMIPFSIYYLLTDYVIAPYMPTSDNIIRDIANTHTILNMISAVMFYPLIDAGAKLIETMFPRSEKEKEFGTEYLNLETYQHTELAFAQARREALRMGDIVISMLKDCRDLLKQEDPELIDSIKNRDNQVDLLQREIKMFLAKLSTPTGELGAENVNLITYISDLESAGDVIDNSIMELARKKHALKLHFSEEGWKEINEMHKIVMEISTLSLTCFHLQDRDLANRVISKKRDLRKLEKHFKESHIERLKKGLKESINTSSIHMDLLSDFRRITGLLVNHAYSISDLAKK
jgi:phosphate:Na+ symporter